MMSLARNECLREVINGETGRLDRRRRCSPRPMPSSTRVTASQAGNDDVEDCDNGVNDGSKNSTNAVDNGHQA